MKNTKLLILISIFTILISSCGKENKKVETNQIVQTNEKKQELKIETKQVGTRNIFEERKVETKLEDGKLTVGKNVVISEGQTEYIDFSFPVVDGGKIFKNSNVKNYGFIISSTTTNIEYIIKFYQTELKKLGWEEKIDNQLEAEQNQVDQDIENQEQIINSKTLIFTKNKTDNILEELRININTVIPEILKDTYKFEGNYVEFYLSNIAVEPEQIENIELNQ